MHKVEWEKEALDDLQKIDKPILKRKSPLTEKASRVTSPFDTSSYKTERTANQKFAEWINQIIKGRNLPLGIAEFFS